MREKGTFLGEIERGWQRFWGLSWWWKGPVIGFVAFLLLIPVAAIFGGEDEDESASLVDAKITASPTETSATSNTEEATSSPTRTDEPTATPTPDPTVDAAAVAYLTDMSSWLDEGQRLTGGVVEISQSANPFSESNAAKALELTQDADAWRDDALAFNAPSEFDEVQMWLELAGVTMADALEDFWLGVTFVDADLIISATDSMTAATGYMDNANAVLIGVD
ncbi:MAG: hypothetical protein IIB18_07670 [Chloroflexi bacterium]|nr:hypothetical protein [Chloroflexota bacterium]